MSSSVSLGDHNMFTNKKEGILTINTCVLSWRKYSNTDVVRGILKILISIPGSSTRWDRPLSARGDGGIDNEYVLPQTLCIMIGCVVYILRHSLSFALSHLQPEIYVTERGSSRAGWSVEGGCCPYFMVTNISKLPSSGDTKQF